MPLKIETIAYHRNGCSGTGFHVVLFKDDGRGGKRGRPMLAIVFPKSGSCAVLDRAETTAGNVAFAMGNSWRGDSWESDLRAAIAKQEGEAIAATTN